MSRNKVDFDGLHEYTWSYYDENWERIDNFFFAGKIEVNQFQPVTEPPLADEASIPQGYKVYTDSGCSDHLPLKCVITI